MSWNFGFMASRDYEALLVARNEAEQARKSADHKCTHLEQQLHAQRAHIEQLNNVLQIQKSESAKETNALRMAQEKYGSIHREVARERDQLRHDYTIMQQENATIKKEHHECKLALEGCQDKVIEAIAEISESKLEVEKVEAEFNELKSEYATLKKKYQEGKFALEQCQETMVPAAEPKEKNAQCESLSFRLNQLQQSLAERSNEVKYYEAQHKKDQLALEQCQMTMVPATELEKEKAKHAKENEHLQQSLRDKDNQITMMRREAQEGEVSYSKAERRYLEERREHEKTRNEKEYVKKKYELLCGAYSTAQVARKQQELAVEKMEQQIAEILSQKDAEINNLEQQHSENLAAMGSHFSEQSKILSEKQSEIDNVLERYDSLLKSMVDLQNSQLKQLAEKAAENDKLEQEHRKVLCKKESQIANLQAAHYKRVKAMGQLEKEMCILKKEHRGELEYMESKYQTMLNNKVWEIEITKNLCELKVNKLNSQIEQLEKDAASLRATCETLTSELEKARAEGEELRAEVRDLEGFEHMDGVQSDIEPCEWDEEDLDDEADEEPADEEGLDDDSDEGFADDEEEMSEVYNYNPYEEEEKSQTCTGCMSGDYEESSCDCSTIAEEESEDTDDEYEMVQIEEDGVSEPEKDDW